MRGVGRALGIALWGVVVLLPGETFAQPPVTPAPPSLVSAAAVLAKVQALYGAAHSFSADFAIVSHTATRDVELKAGHVVFTAPGNSDWTWGNGNTESFVGLTWTSYAAGTHRTSVTRVKNPYRAPYLAGLAFLPGGVAPSAYHFELGASKAGFYGYVLVGKPLPWTPTTDYPKAVFYVDARSFEIERVVLVEDDGDALGFAFSHIIIR